MLPSVHNEPLLFQMVLEQRIQVQTGMLQLSCGETMTKPNQQHPLLKRNLFLRHPRSVKTYSQLLRFNSANSSVLFLKDLLASLLQITPRYFSDLFCWVKGWFVKMYYLHLKDFWVLTLMYITFSAALQQKWRAIQGVHYEVYRVMLWSR